MDSNEKDIEAERREQQNAIKEKRIQIPFILKPSQMKQQSTETTMFSDAELKVNRILGVLFDIAKDTVAKREESPDPHRGIAATKCK